MLMALTVTRNFGVSLEGVTADKNPTKDCLIRTRIFCVGVLLL